MYLITVPKYTKKQMDRTPKGNRQTHNYSQRFQYFQLLIEHRKKISQDIVDLNTISQLDLINVYRTHYPTTEDMWNIYLPNQNVSEDIRRLKNLKGFKSY